MLIFAYFAAALGVLSKYLFSDRCKTELGIRVVLQELCVEKLIFSYSLRHYCD